VYVSARTDYALRALVVLARSARARTVQEMADEEGLPPRYLGVVLVQLRRAGIVAARRGRHAGYRLVDDPASVTAAAVVRAVDGLLAELPDGQQGGVTGAAEDGGPRLQAMWAAVQDSVEGVLAGVTIADLAGGRTMPAGSPAASR
jgi:Rrf2 family protein